MARRFAWSYSALSAFETCPRQYHEMRIKKAWPDPPGEVQQYGTMCHKYLENRIAQATPLPTFLNHLEPILQRLEGARGELHAEQRYALNAQFQPVEFFAGDAWVRAVGDLVKLNNDVGFAMDYKFGKFKEGDDQLRLQSAIMMANYPSLQKMACVYVWVKEKRTTVRTFTRADVPAIWQSFLPRVKRMEAAFEAGQFDPKPSGLCRKYCRVESCQFHGKGAY